MSYLSSFPGEIGFMGVLWAEPTSAMIVECADQPRKPGAQAA